MYKMLNMYNEWASEADNMVFLSSVTMHLLGLVNYDAVELLRERGKSLHFLAHTVANFVEWFFTSILKI